MSLLMRALWGVIFGFLASTGAWAQNPFAAVAQIDDGVVTRFQLEQRLGFLTTLRAPGTERDLVLETLIDEHLQVRAARGAGIEVSQEDIQAGITEFASRANLEAEAFLKAVSEAGTAPETVRDFVRNGLFWRKYVQQRFGPLARPSEDEIDRALAQTSKGGAVRVLLSEIAIPLPPDPAQAEQNRGLAEDLARQIRSRQEFASAARRFSASPTAQKDGRLDWLPLSNLPPTISTEVLVAAPGEVLGPVNMGGFLALFLMRGLEERAPRAAETLAVDFVEVPIPGGRSPEALALADVIRARSDTCDDLYGTLSGLPVGALSRQVLPVRELSRDLALELAKLDANEVSTLLTGVDGALRYIMLCARTAEVTEGARQEVLNRLFNQRLESYASGHLDELRASARITKADG